MAVESIKSAALLMAGTWTTPRSLSLAASGSAHEQLGSGICAPGPSCRRGRRRGISHRRAPSPRRPPGAPRLWPPAARPTASRTALRHIGRAQSSDSRPALISSAAQAGHAVCLLSLPWAWACSLSIAVPARLSHGRQTSKTHRRRAQGRRFRASPQACRDPAAQPHKGPLPASRRAPLCTAGWEHGPPTAARHPGPAESSRKHTFLH